MAEESPTGQRARRLRDQAEVLSAQVQRAEMDAAVSTSHKRGLSSPAAGAPSCEAIAGMRRRLQTLRGQAEGLFREAASEVLQSVQVVACTCAGEQASNFA
jgi:hypothetical protein